MLYNENDKNSIENFARQLLNKSLYAVLGEDLNHRFENKRSKGRLGQVVEESYFGYKVNSKQEADFGKADIELKVAPLKKIKPKIDSKSLREKEGISAKERIVLTIIDFMRIYIEEWDNNSLLKKCRNLLLMFYIHDNDKHIEELVFKIINVWSPSKNDLLVIKRDWELIINKIRQGRAHEISEGDTLYLGACTKGSTAEKSKREQPFSDVMAPQRAFCLKRAYVDYIIEELLQRETYEKIDEEKSVANNFKDKPFDKVILNTFKAIEGFTLEQMINKYNITRERKAKNFIRLIIDDICKQLFGEKLDKLSEFKKSDIEIKTILLKPNGMPKESMSFEQIDFQEIVNENWEESIIRDKFENKKHLWIIFKSKRNFEKQSELSLDDILLHKVMFWNMPIIDLEGSMKLVWQDTVNKISLGDYNNFIKISQGEIAHIRPKGIDNNDVMLTPQGTYERKKSFWLNAKYIKEQIEKED